MRSRPDAHSDSSTDSTRRQAPDGSDPGDPHELRPVQRGTETDFSYGSGLGLWRLRWSIEKLGGDLSFETDGETTVRITVPDPTAGG